MVRIQLKEKILSLSNQNHGQELLLLEKDEIIASLKSQINKLSNQNSINESIFKEKAFVSEKKESELQILISKISSLQTEKFDLILISINFLKG